MKKLVLILSILLALLTIGQAKAQGLTGSGTTDDPYLITSSADWNTFAQSVTNGTTYAGQTVKLTADITANVMAGSHTDESNYHAFSGTFDGDGHAITLALSGSGEGIALFSDLNGATLKNLKAQGTVSTDDRRPATFAVIVFGNSTISNCWSTVAVSSTRTSDWVDGGGFVGRVSSNATLNMTDCAFHGSVTFAPGATTGGGMIGYTQNNATVNLTDCLYSPSALTLNVSQYNPRVFVSGEVSGNLNNCYYNAVAANSVLENQGIDASGMTDAALAAALGEGWHVYNDMVVPFTGKYYISSAAEWNAFATTVNNGTSYSGQIVALTTDIPTAVTTMAGTESNPFCGTFDGDGHTITLALSGSGQGTALFYLIEGATLKNLKVQGTVTTSGYRPATFTAFVEGNSTISNCWSTVAVSSTKTNSWVDGGGFVGRVSSNATLNMTGCAFHGSVTFDSTATTGGGMVGFTQTDAVVNLTNCLYSPTELTLNVSQYYPRIFVSGYVPGNLNNCYYNAVAANSALENQGKLMHSIAGDANVTVAFDGEATAYDLSGISAYSVGMVYDSTLYAGQGETVSLNLGCTPPSGYVCSGYTTSSGTLTGTANPYTLTMPDEDVTIQAVLELPSSVDYIDGDGETQTCTDFTILTGNETTLEAGWYVVISDIFYDSTLTLNGDVNLILCDSTTMTISNSTNPPSYAIKAEGDLTIYGQSGGTGTLSAPFSTYIGLYTNEGNVEINGGIVTLCGFFTGIDTNGGDVIIRGGVVTVTGNGSYGIFSRPGNVIISGGTVTSIGNANSISCQNVNISGGKVTATGNGAFGIDCSNFIISGGEVTTLGGAYGINSAGDGSTNGNITIGGGKVTATGSGVSGIYGFNIIITGGEVTATTGSGNGSYGISGYNVIISDGIVMARGNRSGIGSGTNSTDGSLTISGGTVTATGSGYGIIGSNVIINGGEVTANGIGYGIFGFDIIISDGEVTANATGSCIGLGDNSTKGSLTISGGTVTATGASESIFVYGDVDISGGTVTATGNNMGIYCSGDVNISGGIVAANGNYVYGIYSTNGSITISGGKVSASGYHNGISVSDDITLGWTNTDDYISANGYNATNGIVAVRSGQALYYEDDGGENVIVSGILDENQLQAIGGKTLRPYPLATYTLTPTAYTLTNGGYTDIQCTLSSLELDLPVWDGSSLVQATSLSFYMHGGTLTDSIGNSIPFLVDNESHSGATAQMAQGGVFSSEGDTLIMAVYIDSVAYAIAVPGTYTGEFVYDSYWNGNTNIHGPSGSIGLKLVINNPVNYIDGDGEMHICTDYTALTGNETMLDAGWYVVKNDLAYSHTLTLNGDVTLILCNGMTMTVAPDSGKGIDGFQSNLTIYGQSLDSIAGTLNVISDGSNAAIGLVLGNYTQHSGNFVASNSGGSTLSAGDIIINGGSINANRGGSKGSTFSFYACAQDARSAAEHFGENVTGRALGAMDFFPPENTATSEYDLDNLKVALQSNDEVLFFDSFEDYTVDNKIAQEAIAAGNDWWTTWSNAPGGAEDGVVSDIDTNCGHLTYGNDQVLLLGDEENGNYDLEFDILVPEGKNGYFNILHHFAGSNSTWAMQCYLHLTNDGQNSTSAPGHGTIHAGSNGTADVECVYDEWMHFRLNVDTDTDVANYYYTAPGEDEVLVCTWQWSLDSFGNSTVGRSLAAMNFFPPENAATSEYYLDNFSFKKIGGESAPELTITPTAVAEELGEDDMTSVEVTIDNSGNSIGDWVGWLDFGQGGTGSQTAELYYHNDEVGTGIGSSDACTREIGIRLPATAYAGAAMGMRITSAKYYIYDEYASADYNYIFRIYGQGLHDQPGELLAEKTVNSMAAGTWITATFDEPVYLTGQAMWATVSLEQNGGEYPLSMDGGEYGEEQDGNWLSTNGNSFRHCYSAGSFGGAWMITVNCEGELIPATWATIDKTEGAILGGQSETITLSLNSIGLDMGTSYNANLVINTNDAELDHVEIPVTLAVTDSIVETGDVVIQANNLTINGGKVETNSIYAYDNITLGWTNTDDYILAGSYEVDEGIVSVKSGQAFYYENGIHKHVMDTVVVSGTLDEDQIDAIGGKPLRPHIVPSTVIKEIAGYGTGDGGWQLIASPLQGTISPTTIDNLIADTAAHYDLYRFEPSHEGNEWENHKASDTFKLETGKGYLYANADNVTLTFSGPSYIGDNCEIALVYDANDEQKCWNLVGNPFDFNATLDREYYVLDENGLDINPEPIPATTPVPPCTAVFVKAVEEGDAVVFTRVTQ